MKRLALILALCVVSTYAQAWGVPFAADSLQKAQESTRKDSAKHLLVFYTSET